jgi:glycosyltransferase involved in cell wall biosynthesis
MKKILLATGIFYPDIGGPASYGKLIGEELSKITKTELITYSSVKNHSDDQYLPFKVNRVWKKWPWFIRHLIYFLKIFSRAKHYDVLYALNTLNAGLSCYYAAQTFKKKFYVRIVGDYAWQVAQEKGKTDLGIDEFQKSEKRGKIKSLYELQRKVCKNADKVIVPSEYLKKIVMGWGVPENNLVVIYNGVNFKPADMEKEEARKQIGISGNIILSAGRLAPWKGFRMLIKMMPELIEMNQFARLVIVGDGPDQDLLKSMIKNLKLEKKVYLVGAKSKEELAIYLAAADLFVLNTGYEGFSHQILEVMAAGIPIVTTNVGGNKEIMEHGENGLIVEYNDEFGLVAAVKTIWERPEVGRKITNRARRSVGLFNPDQMVEQIVTLLMS